MQVLVTGASPGIGGACCRRLAADAKRDGKKIQIAACEFRPTPEIDALKSDLEAMGAEVITAYGDLSDPETPAKLVEQAVAAFGGLSAIVSNAGTVAPKALNELTVSDWDFVMNINVRAGWLLAQAAFPYLKASGGSYVAIASMSGMGPHPLMGAYSPSKAACINVTALLAQEWAADGVRANTIAPGMIQTPFTANVYADPDMLKRRNEAVPIGRVGTAEDIADVAAFLLSQDARYMTGQNVCVDGGFASSILAHVPGRPLKKD
ncbi:MAG: SDR family NAD(P)-dependent oxidoreductase [Alphaproteobacteria bacterium]